MSNELKQFLLLNLGFQGHLLVRYLGLPLILGKLSTGDCKVLLERVQQRISSWRTKYLSYAGRVQLDNSVLAQIQVYWSQAFLIPSKVQKQIDSSIRNFVWSGYWNKQSIPLVAWEDVCAPRKDGGLGIKQARIWNKAALCKHIWQGCQYTRSLWSVWMKQNLLKGKNIWSHEIPTDCMWSWRKIL